MTALCDAASRKWDDLVTRGEVGSIGQREGQLVTSAVALKHDNPLTTAVNGLQGVERKGVEPSTSALRTQQGDDVSANQTEVMETGTGACTAACTNEREIGQNRGVPADPIDHDLARLVEIWPNLPEAIRRCILAMVETAITSSRPASPN